MRYLDTFRYEMRDPIHGFVLMNEWERDIINHPVFQRLRRIRQLGWTEMVYPGAMHTRFEHSLGMMHVATQMFKNIVDRRRDFLSSELNYLDTGFEKDLVLVRLAALLHDVGHAPFSHATEDLMPVNPESGKHYKHENYSAAAISFLMKDVIENHRLNQNFGIKAQDISDFLNGRTRLGRVLLWRALISSQLDADRADYLLRDSHHIGVAYGRFDLHRLLVTMTIGNDPEEGSPILAVEEGGDHAAEGLIVARYMMFTQVYFQKTRRAYDHHTSEAVKSLLEKAGDWLDEASGKFTFPPPTTEANIRKYLEWTDWKVLGAIQNGDCGEHGDILLQRKHHRRVYETPETPTADDIDFAQTLCGKLGEYVAFVDRAENSWYKFGKEDIGILQATGTGSGSLQYLSGRSSVVNALKPVRQTRIYSRYDERKEARELVEKLKHMKGAET